MDKAKGGAEATGSPFVVIKIEVYEATASGKRVRGGNGLALVTRAVAKARARSEAAVNLEDALRWARVPRSEPEDK